MHHLVVLALVILHFRTFSALNSMMFGGAGDRHPATRYRIQGPDPEQSAKTAVLPKLALCELKLCC